MYTLKLEETIAKRNINKTDKITARKVKISQEWQVRFLDRLLIYQISWTVIHFIPYKPLLYLQTTAIGLLFLLLFVLFIQLSCIFGGIWL